MIAEELRQDPRFAGQVQRWHTWPCVGAKETIAHHSWNTIRLLLAIYPAAPRDLIIHAAFHDIGESSSGDPPYPIKQQYPELKVVNDKIEKDAHLRMCLPWGLPAPVALGETEKQIFKIADNLDMWEWGHHEAALGSAYGRIVVDRLGPVLAEQIKRIGNAVPDVAKHATAYMAKRTKVMEQK